MAFAHRARIWATVFTALSSIMTVTSALPNAPQLAVTVPPWRNGTPAWNTTSSSLPMGTTTVSTSIRSHRNLIAAADTSDSPSSILSHSFKASPTDETTATTIGNKRFTLRSSLPTRVLETLITTSGSALADDFLTTTATGGKSASSTGRIDATEPSSVKPTPSSHPVNTDTSTTGSPTSPWPRSSYANATAVAPSILGSIDAVGEILATQRQEMPSFVSRLLFMSAVSSQAVASSSVGPESGASNRSSTSTKMYYPEVTSVVTLAPSGTLPPIANATTRYIDQYTVVYLPSAVAVTESPRPTIWGNASAPYAHPRPDVKGAIAAGTAIGLFAGYPIYIVSANKAKALIEWIKHRYSLPGQTEQEALDKITKDMIKVQKEIPLELEAGDEIAQIEQFLTWREAAKPGGTYTAEEIKTIQNSILKNVGLKDVQLWKDPFIKGLPGWCLKDVVRHYMQQPGNGGNNPSEPGSSSNSGSTSDDSFHTPDGSADSSDGSFHTPEGSDSSSGGFVGSPVGSEPTPEDGPTMSGGLGDSPGERSPGSGGSPGGGFPGFPSPGDGLPGVNIPAPGIPGTGSGSPGVHFPVPGIPGTGPIGGGPKNKPKDPKPPSEPQDPESPPKPSIRPSKSVHWETPLTKPNTLYNGNGRDDNVSAEYTMTIDPKTADSPEHSITATTLTSLSPLPTMTSDALNSMSATLIPSSTSPTLTKDIISSASLISSANDTLSEPSTFVFSTTFATSLSPGEAARQRWSSAFSTLHSAPMTESANHTLHTSSRLMSATLFAETSSMDKDAAAKQRWSSAIGPLLSPSTTLRTQTVTTPSEEDLARSRWSSALRKAPIHTAHRLPPPLKFTTITGPAPIVVSTVARVTTVASTAVQPVVVEVQKSVATRKSLVSQKSVATVTHISHAIATSVHINHAVSTAIHTDHLVIVEVPAPSITPVLRFSTAKPVTIHPTITVTMPGQHGKPLPAGWDPRNYLCGVHSWQHCCVGHRDGTFYCYDDEAARQGNHPERPCLYTDNPNEVECCVYEHGYVQSCR